MTSHKIHACTALACLKFKLSCTIYYECDLICKNPYLWIFSFLYHCVLGVLSFVMLQYEACIMNSLRVTVLGNNRCNKVDFYAILWRSNLHTFNYTTITHIYFSWNLDHCLQCEIAIPLICNITATTVPKRSKFCNFQPHTNKHS